ncbi:MAG: NAD-dependent epimerase/dehydratase family protein [Fidelibacterota bacterium]
MRKPIILITGANGEIGHGLIRALSEKLDTRIVGLDLDPLENAILPLIAEALQGNILDRNLLERVNAEFEVTTIYHLAAILSTRAEFSPMTAHNVNVGGTINLLHLAMEQSISQGRPVKFFFPSSIAVYGLNDITEKNHAGPVSEDDYRHPETIYGCNKLYCENLGIYFSRFYKRLSAESSRGRVDFRAIRLPGLISAQTLPAGGTSDFAPEMIHRAAQHKPYHCFVRKDTALPFMTMADAIKAILNLMAAGEESLSRAVYNVTSFSQTAAEFREKTLSYFPEAKIDFVINDKRQSIVDSWPAQVNDDKAREDWDWEPEHDFNSAFEDYLIPEINKRYEID